MGSLDDAKSYLSRALGLKADGQVEEAKPWFDEAEQLLQEAIAHDPNSVQAHYCYALLLEQGLQQYPQAETEYQTALRLDPTDEVIQAAYEAMKAEQQLITRPPSVKAPSLVQEAASAVEPGPEHEEYVTRVTWEPDERLSAGSTPAVASLREADKYWALGALELEQGDQTAAQEALEQALNLVPTHVGALKEYSSLLLNQHRYDEAEKQLASLMEVDPSAVDVCLAEHAESASPFLMALHGSLYAQRGEWGKAGPLLHQALELEPRQTKWIVTHTRALVELGRSQEAVDRLRDALSHGLSDAALHREYARLLAPTGRYDEVKRHLKLAQDIAPDDPAIQALYRDLQPKIDAYQAADRCMALAKMRIRQGLTDEAQELFEEALKNNSRHLPTLKEYAAFLEKQQHFGDAEQLWARVAANAPEEAEAHFQAILTARGENSETLNGLARVLIQLGRFPEAEARLRHSLDLAPNNPETLHLLTQVLARLNRRREAELILSSRLALVETDAQLSLDYARLLATRRDYDRAKKLYRRARELAPADAEIADAWEEVADQVARFEAASPEMALGWMLAQEGKYDEAEALYQRALEIDPEHVPTLIRYARLLEDTCQPARASVYLVRLARLDPEVAEEHYRSHLSGFEGNPALRSAYASFLQSLGRLDEAAEQFRLTLQEQSTYLPALNPYVDLLLEAGEAHEAELPLKCALDHGDAAPEVYWRYGNLLVKRHRYDLAGPYLARAAKLAPEDARFSEALGQITEKLGQVRQAELAWALALEKAETDPAEADSLFREARAACPDYVPALVDYGEFLLKQGQRDEALCHWKEAIRLDPYEENAARRLAELEVTPPVLTLSGEEN